MKITALVENTSHCELRSAPGLALYIEAPRHKLLFDLGPDDTLFQNCERRGIDLGAVDTVVISHGHGDHGGALRGFLERNHTAKVYIQRSAFAPDFSKVLGLKVNVGLDPHLEEHPQVVLLDGEHRIDEELLLFTVPDASKYRSPANDSLYAGDGPDSFAHEQDLMITADRRALVMGCGHCGVVNILERAAQYRPELCVGGYHLWNPMRRRTAPEEVLSGIAGVLAQYDMDFYTCHCTGRKAFRYLSGRLPRMHDLSCGETIE